MSLGPLEILMAIVGLSILVIVHESGHYLAARAFKMKVLRYSIGFGPTIFKYKPKDSPTTFQVAAIPFLAYVQIAGMNPYEEHEEGETGLFNQASVLGRIVTIGAGPFANYLLAALLAFGIGLAGWPAGAFRLVAPDDERGHGPAVAGALGEESPALAAGMEVGDQILEVNGQTIRRFADVVENTRDRNGQPTDYVVMRGDEQLTLSITPVAEDDGPARIGVVMEQTVTDDIQLGVGEAASMALTVPWRLTVVQLQGIKNMIVRMDSSGLGGPVAIAKGMGEAAKAGPSAFLVMLMLMSVALGLFNLLPFPALDGGRLLFLGFEVITRRKPNERFEAVVHTVGIVILLVVVALVTIRDIGG